LRLRLQNDVLLMENLHKFFNRAYLPWVKLIWTNYYQNAKVPSAIMKCSFWWNSILKLLDTFKGIAQTNFETGDTILFCFGLWNDSILKLVYPQLFSFTINENIIVQSVMQGGGLANIFQLPLSMEAFEQ
jgi:hypothetical protein